MNLIKFFNRHVFTSIILYFALMVGVAWAVTEHIAARTKLAVMPDDNDVLAIYDTDAGLGYGIEVSVFRGTNLNAIVNAASGVASPGITMYDSSAEAGTAFVYGTSTGAYDVVMSLGVEDSSSASGSPYIELNGTTETTKIYTLDYGTRFEGVVGDFNITTGAGGIYADMCSLFFMAGDHSGDATWTLPASGHCATTTIGDLYSLKRFELISNDPDDGHEIILTPAAGDTIKVRGGSESESCAQDQPLYIHNYGAVTIYGRTASEWWVVPHGSTEVNCNATTS